MTPPPPPSSRFRVGRPDLVPILVAGVAATVVFLAGDRIARAFSPAPEATGPLAIVTAAGLGIALSVALAGMQGRAGDLSPRHAVTGWLRFLLVAGVVLVGDGERLSQFKAIRLAVDLIAALGISFLLFAFRKRRS